MTWLTWRQFRTGALVVLSGLALFAAALVAAAPHRRFIFNSIGGLSYDLYYGGIAVTYAVPGILGVFWGAPLISRELEAGSIRLAWSQSVTRTRWLATKLGLMGLVTVGAAGLTSLTFTWWLSPINKAVGHGSSTVVALPPLRPVAFGSQGIAPLGYAALAFALGVVAGLVVRRVVPAMAITLAVFVAIQIAVPIWVRPSHLMAPTQHTIVITNAHLQLQQPASPRGRVPIDQDHLFFNAPPGTWVVSDQILDPDGHPLTTLPNWAVLCKGGFSGNKNAAPCFAKLRRLGYRQRVTYHPASHFWPLQWRETGLYLVLAAALTGFCFWRIRRLS